MNTSKKLRVAFLVVALVSTVVLCTALVLTLLYSQVFSKQPAIKQTPVSAPVSMPAEVPTEDSDPYKTVVMRDYFLEIYQRDREFEIEYTFNILKDDVVTKTESGYDVTGNGYKLRVVYAPEGGPASCGPDVVLLTNPNTDSSIFRAKSPEISSGKYSAAYYSRYSKKNQDPDTNSSLHKLWPCGGDGIGFTGIGANASCSVTDLSLFAECDRIISTMNMERLGERQVK